MNVEDNSGDLMARLRARAERALNTAPPLTAAGDVVRTAAVLRFTNNDWAANSPFTIAQKGSSRPGIDTGALRNSIVSNLDGDNAVVIGPGGPAARYAAWFQSGTGVFAGHSAWVVEAKNGGALRFKAPGGGFFFARKVTIQGSVPRPFLLIEDQQRVQILALFNRWISEGAL